MKSNLVVLLVVGLGLTGCASLGKRNPASAEYNPQNCSNETIAKFSTAVDRSSRYYADRALTCSEYKTMSAALEYSQRVSCQAIDYTALLVNDVLNQRDANPGYFKQLDVSKHPCP